MDGKEIAGKDLLVASYGSGAQAEIHAETVQPSWKDRIDSIGVNRHLERRVDISFPEYELVHDVHNHAIETGPDTDHFSEPDGEFVFEGWGPMNERQYRFAD